MYKLDDMNTKGKIAMNCHKTMLVGSKVIRF